MNVIYICIYVNVCIWIFGARCVLVATVLSSLKRLRNRKSYILRRETKWNEQEMDKTRIKKQRFFYMNIIKRGNGNDEKIAVKRKKHHIRKRKDFKNGRRRLTQDQNPYVKKTPVWKIENKSRLRCAVFTLYTVTKDNLRPYTWYFM